MRHQANGVRYWDRQKVHKKQAYPGNKVFTILIIPTPALTMDSLRGQQTTSLMQKYLSRDVKNQARDMVTIQSDTRHSFRKPTSATFTSPERLAMASQTNRSQLHEVVSVETVQTLSEIVNVETVQTLSEIVNVETMQTVSEIVKMERVQTLSEIVNVETMQTLSEIVKMETV